jgi:AcrR family transcriptional regulator
MSPENATAAYPRATRTAGRQMRSALLDAAGRLFAGRALAEVSAAEIAREAGAFPSQVTYYFGSKEALFVEAACRGMLHAATDVERAGSRARTPRTYFRSMVETALASPALPTFIEATFLVRRRPDLAPTVRDAFTRLHTEAERALVEKLTSRGWSLRTQASQPALSFWAAVLGVVVERAAFGDSFGESSAEATVELLLSLYIAP